MSDKNDKVNPPYISFTSFFNALRAIVKESVPAQVDRTVLTSYSGTVQKQLVAAFKYLGFIEKSGDPTEQMKHFAEMDESGQKALMAEIIRSKYSTQVELGANGTLKQLQDSFDWVSLDATSKKRCIDFFLKAAQETGIPISTHIAKAAKTRAPRTRGQGSSRSSKGSNRQQDVDQLDEPGGCDNNTGTLRSIPIPLSPSKTWYIKIDNEPQTEEIGRFLQIIKIILGYKEE